MSYAAGGAWHPVGERVRESWVRGSVAATRMGAAAAAVALTVACSGRAPGRAMSDAISSEGIDLDEVPVTEVVANEQDSTSIVGLVGGGTRLSNGHVVVLDRRAASLIVFDSTGRFVRRVGRIGEGPGEFKLPEWLGQCSADTLFVWDGGRSVLTRFDSEGRFVDQQRLLRAPWRLSCSLGSGIAILTMPRGLRMSSAKSPLYHSSLLFWKPATDTITEVDSVPAFRNRPLSPMTSVAATSDRVYVGTADSGLISAYDWLGGKHIGVTFSAPARPVTSKNYAAAVAEQVAPLGLQSDRDFFSKRLLTIPAPERLPAYRSILADRDGNLWVVTSARGDDRTEVLVIDPPNELLGKITFPYDLDLLYVGTQHLLAYFEDSRDAPHIVVYRFTANHR